MRKADEFSKVLDLLDNDEKDELLASANGLMKAQKAIRVNPIRAKSSNTGNQKGKKQKSAKD
jgi:hypothetical protein